MKMRNMCLLVLFLASLGGVQSVSAGDFKASTHLKSNRHAYAALFAALGATNLAYLFATGKLDKTKLKRLLSKEQRAATLQLVAPSLAALLLAGGVEAYGYGYREEGGKPKDNDVPVRASALDIINQPALAEISQPSVKPEAVVEAPLIGRATSPTSIALPEVSSKPAPSGVLRSATPPCVTAIPGDERREGGDKPKGNDSAGALRITAPSTPVTVDLSESVSQSSSSVSESEEDISDDFEGEEEGLLGCEEAMYALESDFADSQSVALKGLAAKITALRAERRSGIVLRDRVRAFMRMNVHSLSGLTSEELQALLEFLILDAEVYDAYRKSVPEAGLHRCLEAHVYEAYRLIRLAQREGCVLPEEVSAALQDRSTLLKSEIGDVGGELSFALSFASTVTDEGVWSGFALERLFQEEESKRLAEQFESHPDSLPFITLPEVTSAGAGGPPVTQVTPVRAVTPPVAASVAVGPTPSHAPGVQTPVDVASGSAVVVPGLLAEERPVAFTADAVDPAPSSVTPGDGEIPSDVYFSNFKKKFEDFSGRKVPAGDDRFLKHLGEGYLNRPNPEYARSRVAQIINGRIKPLPQIDNADLETLLSYLIPDRTLYEFWQHDDSWCQHLLSGAARAVFRLVAGTDLYGKRDCCLSDSLYRSLIQRIDLLPLLDGQQSFLREVVSHACTRPGSLTGMQARVESLFPMVDKPSRVLMPPLPTVVVMPPVLPNPEPSVLTVDSAAAEVDPSLEVNPLIGAGDGAPSELVEPEGSDVPHELIDSVVAGVESDSLTEAGAAGLTDPEEAAASSLESESPAFCPVDFKKAWTALIGHVNSKKRHKRSGFMDSLLSVCNAKEKDFRRYTRIVIKIANSADIALLDQTDLERILGYVVPDTALYESYKNKDLDEDLARVYRLVKLTKCRLSTESATELQRRIRSLPESAQRQNLIILVEEAARNPRTPTFSIEGLEKAFSEGESLASRRR